ncbi:Protein-arginine deiminase type-2, partial [Ophiophagus hannah]
VKHSQNVSVEVISHDQSDLAPANGAKQWPLDPTTFLQIQMTQPSVETNDSKESPWTLTLTTMVWWRRTTQRRLCGPGARTARVPSCWLTVTKKIHSAARRTVRMRKYFPRKGPSRLVQGYDELKRRCLLQGSPMPSLLRPPDPFFGQRYIHILGRRKLSHVVKYTGGSAELEFFVEGLRFPDESFDGLVYVYVSLLEPMAEECLMIEGLQCCVYLFILLLKQMFRQGIPQTPIFTDTVLFRDNYLFLKEINSLVSKAGCRIRVCSRYMNRGDRWMQDEIEFGYVQAPHKQFPVVLDSPRDGGLEHFAVKEILGPDFGYVTQEPLFEIVTSLDSFGNLEVSPPVSVHGKEYPLGRILIGSSFPTSGGRRMTKVVRNFLQAQRVQSPVELYSDWLTVGHVDEFQFRMLMASPSVCYKFFREKQKGGHGEAIMFKGYSGTDTKRVTINKVLSNDIMVQENQYVQRCIDWNRDILKKELGLKEKDIIDLPALFKIDKGGKAMAYFPNMVNMIVLSRDLGVPKPFGPIIEGECCLEQYVSSLLEPLGLTCTFIDDISSYHKLLGEVHCGTNVQRKPFAFKWWNMVP